jgi:hypothetical protein
VNRWQRSARLVVAWLGQLPRLGVLLAVIAVTAGGFFLPGVLGALFLLVLAGLASCLLTASWPVLGTPGRAVRIAIPLVLLVVAASKF